MNEYDLKRGKCSQLHFYQCWNKKPRQYTGALKACLLKKSCNRKGSCPKHSDKIHCCRYEKLNYLPYKWIYTGKLTINNNNINAKVTTIQSLTSFTYCFTSFVTDMFLVLKTINNNRLVKMKGTFYSLMLANMIP